METELDQIIFLFVNKNSLISSAFGIMSGPLPDLDNYHLSPPTSSCYLDGRYFNKVFAEYPGLIETPLTIQFQSVTDPGSTEEKFHIDAYMKQGVVKPNIYTLIRIVIESEVTVNGQTTKERHCGLMLIDPSKYQIYWLDPAHYQHKARVARALTQYNGYFLDKFVIVPVDIDDELEKNPDCQISGFCNAYVIKYAYDVVLGDEPSFKDIRRFAGKIEEYYGQLDPNGADIEYGLFDNQNNDNQGRNVLIGGLGGALLGGALTGSVGGALVGGLGGGLIGGAASGR